MRGIFVVPLALLAIVHSPAAAQTCLGLASFSRAPVQMTGTGQFTQRMNSFGAGIAYGLQSGVWGKASVATTSIDGIESHPLSLGASAGYQIPVGKAQQAQVCPNASFTVGNGPDDAAADINGSSRQATVGVNVGTVLAGSNPRMKIVPTVGLSYAYLKNSAKDSTGTSLFEIADSYGLAQLGVGLVLNQTISVRPSVDIPLGLEGSDPTFGITLGYNFGSGPSASRRR
jgi:hypothetical protein